MVSAKSFVCAAPHLNLRVVLLYSESSQLEVQKCFDDTDDTVASDTPVLDVQYETIRADKVDSCSVVH